MVFDYLKKKLQDAITSSGRVPVVTRDGGYEDRRRAAEALHAAGKTTEAVLLLEALAAELAGSSNFTLAVAVRHQIHQWTPERADIESPEADGEWMSAQRDSSGEVEPPSADAGLQKAVDASPLLSELTADEIASLIKTTGLRAYAPKDVVLKEGSRGEELYIVTRGFFDVRASGVKGNEVRVGKLSLGDFFGEVALLTGKPRAATVVAETEAECLQVSSENWKILSEKHPRIRQLLDEAIRVRAQLSADAILDDLRRSRG